MVKLVGWVAGVDHKEKSMVITCMPTQYLIRVVLMIVDDGDGRCVLPVTMFLTLQTIKPIFTKGDTTDSHTFLTAKQRKDQRREASRNHTGAKMKNEVKGYARKDIRVGDTVRIVGRVNEYPRRKAGGEMEWVREVVVDEASGGSVGKSALPRVTSRPVSL